MEARQVKNEKSNLFVVVNEFMAGNSLEWLAAYEGHPLRVESGSAADFRTCEVVAKEEDVIIESLITHANAYGITPAARFAMRGYLPLTDAQDRALQQAKRVEA